MITEPRMLHHLIPALGDRLLHQISRSQMPGFLDQKAETFSLNMKRSPEKLRHSPYGQGLGRKMSTADIAQELGITLDTAIKKVSDLIGDLWFLMAEFAREGYAARADLNGSGALPGQNRGATWVSGRVTLPPAVGGRYGTTRRL